MNAVFYSKMIAQGCTGGTCPTGIGDLSTDVDKLVSEIAIYAAGFAGVAAIVLLASGAITLMTSAGDPEKIMAGKEIITNALTGLILIVLSVVVLTFLGWDVLGLGSLGISKP